MNIADSLDEVKQVATYIYDKSEDKGKEIATLISEITFGKNLTDRATKYLKEVYEGW
jgi:hypothetical protein